MSRNRRTGSLTCGSGSLPTSPARVKANETDASCRGGAGAASRREAGRKRNGQIPRLNPRANNRYGVAGFSFAAAGFLAGTPIAFRKSAEAADTVAFNPISLRK